MAYAFSINQTHIKNITGYTLSISAISIPEIKNSALNIAIRNLVWILPYLQYKFNKLTSTVTIIMSSIWNYGIPNNLLTIRVEVPILLYQQLILLYVVNL